MLPPSLRNCTFLVGAGVSKASPSKLPSGEAFSGQIFDLLTHTGTVFLEPDEIFRLRRALTKRIRLEIFLETLASEISAPIAFSPFAKFLRAVPNFNHFAIAALSPRTITTTNQDLLLEEAGKLLPAPMRIIHLHGKCDRISSIVTIISQYLGGLQQHLRSSFRDAVAGRHVVVLGYSGRDIDVMPLLVNFEPSRVTWILHTRSTISQEISPELSHAKEVLGRRLEIISADTSDWLRANLSQDAHRRIKSLQDGIAPVSLPMPKRVRDSFRYLTVGRRNRAVAKVLEHLGEYHQAAGIYQFLTNKDGVNPHQCLVDLARVTARVAGHDAARRIYTRFLRRSSLSSAHRAQTLLGDVEALRNSSKPIQALQQLDKLEGVLKKRKLYRKPDKVYWHFRGWALSARAGICRVEGRPKAANRLYDLAAHAFSRSRDIDGRINVLTWRAEIGLMMGEYKMAVEVSDAAIRDAVAFAKYLVRAWPYYVKAEALALSGRCEEALLAARKAKSFFRRGGNIAGPLWALLLEAECFKEIAPHKVGGVLNKVQRGLEGRQLAHVQSRLYLEQAELARAAGDWVRVTQSLAALRDHLSNRTFFTQPPRILIAHALLVEAECARQQGFDSAIELLRRARDAYARIGATGFVARANVALLLAGRADVPPSHLREECRRKDYRRELTRLEKPRNGFYPIYFV